MKKISLGIYFIKMPRDKVKKAEYDKVYRKEHPEINKNYIKKYPDKRKIIVWKSAGMIDADWSSVYEMFIKENECWICGINFNETTRHKCLDHNHVTGELRYVCCNVCNTHIVG